VGGCELDGRMDKGGCGGPVDIREKRERKKEKKKGK
jgi:hypothetical protein